MQPFLWEEYFSQKVLPDLLRTEHFRILASVSSVDEFEEPLQSFSCCSCPMGDDFDLAVDHIRPRIRHPGDYTRKMVNTIQPAELALAFPGWRQRLFRECQLLRAAFIKSIELVAMG